MATRQLELSEVRNYFRSAPLDIVRVAIELANEAVQDREAKSRKMSANLAKARAAKQPGAKRTRGPNKSTQPAQSNVQAVRAPETVGATAASAD
jgi:hypothetical protein